MQQHGDLEARVAAVKALGQLGEHAAPHAEALRDACFEDEDRNVRQAAVEALFGVVKAVPDALSTRRHT